mgnify:CR=1 FL=1
MEEFRPEFVDQIVVFFGEQFSTLQPKERGHAIGVVANTLASLAVNQAQSVDADGMTATLGTLSERSNELIETLVQDESAGYLFPQSARICDVIREAITQR